MGYFGIDGNPPKITDWAQGIAAIIAVPAAIITFVKLLRRDKDREKQISVLAGVMLETQKQTQQFEYQTGLMTESNEILKEQLTIIASSLKQDNNLKENFRELENRKRKSDIKPHFIFAGAMGQGYSGYYEIRLKNIGKTAYFKEIIVNEDCPIDFRPTIAVNKMINQNEEIKVGGNIKDTSMFVNIVDYEFELTFVDADNNLYKQKVRRFNNASSYKVENPEDILERD